MNQSNPIKKVVPIFGRLMFLHGVSTRTELCKKMNISTNTYDGWKWKDSIPEARLSLEAAKFSKTIDWLKNGDQIAVPTAIPSASGEYRVAADAQA